MRRVIAIALGLGLLMGEASAAFADEAGSVLARVRANGFVRCGIDLTPGFSGVDPNGRATGFDVDFCRAIAAAALGDPQAIRTARVSTRHKFDAVREGEIDVAFGMTTWTYSRDTEMGVSFPVVNFYDGQGFMAWADSIVTSLPSVKAAAVCVQRDTTSQANLRDFLKGSAASMVEAASSEDKFNAFAERRCPVVTGDRSELAAQRARRAGSPDSWLLLPGTISREPLGPVVTDADPLWADIVRWSILVPVVAEARGLTQPGLDRAAPADAELARLLGQDPAFGKALGLDPAWARRILAAVGNYGEIYQRNLGPLGIDRGENALWRDGGLIYAPPLR